MIQPKPGVPLVSMAEIIPEGINPFFGVKLTDHIRPALSQKGPEEFARFRPEQGIVPVFFRFIGVQICRYNIEIPDQCHREAEAQQPFGMYGEPFDPLQLIVKFGSRIGVAVRKVQAGNDNAVYKRLDIPAMRIIRVIVQPAPRFLDFTIPRKDRDAVPALLPLPDRIVTGIQ